jgi:hypothetical protein
VIVSTSSPDAVVAIARDVGVPARVVGTVTDAARGLSVRVGERMLRASIASLSDAYHHTIPRIMDRAPETGAEPGVRGEVGAVEE